ncbi:TPA: hypothetical protein ACH3X1_008103 [Trebouxia sp. C0004]
MKFRCSSGYDLRQYPASMLVSPGVTLGQLNTQVAEQVNALLENVRTQVAYMKHDNAMSYLKYFLAKYNARLQT